MRVSTADQAGRVLRARAAVAVKSTDSRRAALAALALETLSLGIVETPLGSNRGPYIDFLMRDALGLAWCAGYALGLASLVGLTLPLGGFWPNRSVTRLGASSVAGGCNVGRALDPEPGDLVLFRTRRLSDRATGTGRYRHVAIVTGVRPRVGGPSRIVYAEGNARNRVGDAEVDIGNPEIGMFHRFAEAR